MFGQPVAVELEFLRTASRKNSSRRRPNLSRAWPWRSLERIPKPRHHFLPSSAGEVSASYADGGVMSVGLCAHDPSARYAGTSPSLCEGEEYEGERLPSGMP